MRGKFEIVSILSVSDSLMNQSTDKPSNCSIRKILCRVISSSGKNIEGRECVLYLADSSKEMLGIGTEITVDKEGKSPILYDGEFKITRHVSYTHNEEFIKGMLQK